MDSNLIAIIGGGCVLAAIVWWLLMQGQSSKQQASDFHSTLAKLISESKSETVKKHLREAGKASYDDEVA